MTLGFLEKDLLPPEDSRFSLGIQLGTHIYIMVDEITFSGKFFPSVSTKISDYKVTPDQRFSKKSF